MKVFASENSDPRNSCVPNMRDVRDNEIEKLVARRITEELQDAARNLGLNPDPRSNSHEMMATYLPSKYRVQDSISKEDLPASHKSAL